MKLILSLVVLLAGCSAVETKEISWSRVSHEDLKRICANTAEHQNTKLLGCATWPKDFNNKTCTVYTLDTLEAAGFKEQLVLGHETMHCFRGYFHK